METWRDLKPTENQLAFISELEDYAGEYHGITRGDACDFISMKLETQSVWLGDDDYSF